MDARNRQIDVRKQRNLTLAETCVLCLKGIRHRLFRSVLTLSVVVLAVAFFMFLLSENVIVQSVGKGIGTEIARERLAPRMLGHLYEPPPPLLLSRRLAAAANSPEHLAEFAAVTGWDVERVHRLAVTAATEQRFLAFFDALPNGKRVVLVGKQRLRGMLRQLVQPEERQRFSAAIKPMLDIELPGGLDAFDRFLDGYPKFERDSATFADAWRKRVEVFAAVSTAMAGDTPLDAWLAGATDTQLDAWCAQAAEHGFAVTHEDAQTVCAQLQAAALRARIAEHLNEDATRQKWRRAFRERKRTSADAKLLLLDDPRAIAALDGAYPEETLREVARNEAHRQRLQDMERKLAGKLANDETTSALNSRQVFLLVISFLVCMVGIANAMLMAITERFREIATMKCLGATDQYILLQFMIEAAIQGIAGGLLGMAIGFTIAVTKAAMGLGGYVFAYWPGTSLAASGTFSLLVGVLLSVLASIYPSWAASRMAPMDAMRVD